MAEWLDESTEELNSNIRCIEMTEYGLHDMEAETLNSNIRCIEIPINTCKEIAHFR